MSLEQENLRLRKILSGNLGCAELWSEEAEVQVGRFRFPDSTPVTLRWVAPYSEFKGGGSDYYFERHARSIRARVEAWGLPQEDDYLEYGGTHYEDTSTGVQAKIKKRWETLSSLPSIRGILLADSITFHLPVGSLSVSIHKILKGVVLSGVYLGEIDFRSFELDDVGLSGAYYDAYTQWPEGFDYQNSGALYIGPKSNLIGVNISYGDLSGANLDGANLSSANLSSTNLSGANLSGANFRRANLSCADLSGSNLRDADLSGADLTGCVLSGENLDGANLREASLYGADFSEANLEGADLTDASYDSETIWPEGFDPEAAGAVLVED